MAQARPLVYSCLGFSPAYIFAYFSHWVFMSDFPNSANLLESNYAGFWIFVISNPEIVFGTKICLRGATVKI